MRHYTLPMTHPSLKKCVFLGVSSSFSTDLCFLMAWYRQILLPRPQGTERFRAGGLWVLFLFIVSSPILNTIPSNSRSYKYVSSSLLLSRRRYQLQCGSDYVKPGRWLPSDSACGTDFRTIVTGGTSRVDNLCILLAGILCGSTCTIPVLRVFSYIVSVQFRSH